MLLCVVFFFKQKTAYELRISDWSSDVCSSDLMMGWDESGPAEVTAALLAEHGPIPAAARPNLAAGRLQTELVIGSIYPRSIGRATCRERVGQYVEVSVVTV